jgi:L-ascorbate metabolism protein UlaG (beta-lactamase superfamily)
MKASKKKYLRANVLVEPLIDRWYAWPHLIPPATAARNITERHFRIMDSYVTAPDAHASAVKNPALLGGPFMDYPVDRSSDVHRLKEETKRSRKNLVDLSCAIAQLDEMLQSEAIGYSLEPLYSRIPELLRGYVELVYDLNNHPSFRIIEPLLYKSDFYDPSMQSLVLSHISDDDRPFILSTPRLSGNGGLPIQLPFASKAIDALFAMKREPLALGEIKEQLGFSQDYDAMFESLLTDESPRPYAKYSGTGARWRYFGHACVLFETKDCSILVDPILSYTYESTISRYTYDDLPDFIDYVLITHNHQDHILFETLLQIRHKVGQIVVPRCGGGSLQDPSLVLTFRNCGFDNVVELGEMDEIEFENGSIVGIPFLGEHCDLDVRSKLAYLVRTNSHSIMFAADSCNINPDMYRHVRHVVGEIDVLFLGMECDGAPVSWLYGPLLTKRLERKMDYSRRLAGSDYARALAMVEEFKCKEVYVYAMGQEPWLNHIMSIKYTAESNPIVHSNRLIATARERSIVAERLFGEKEILLP